MKTPSFAKTLIELALSELISEKPDVLCNEPGADAIEVDGDCPTVLCIHGFTGVPAEVAIGCEVAKRLGLSALAFRLAGHGTSSDDLKKTRYADWFEEARRQFDSARQKGPVFLLGLSLGSLIATELTLSAPADVRGLILLSNAFWLNTPYPRLALKAASALGLSNLNIKKDGPDLGDAAARRLHVGYRVQPLHTAIEVLKAGERLREMLPSLHRPTLLLHGARDKVCHVSNAYKAAQRIGTHDTRTVIFPHSHHILTCDVERVQVGAEIESFIRRRLEA